MSRSRPLLPGRHPLQPTRYLARAILRSLRSATTRSQRGESADTGKSDVALSVAPPGLAAEGHRRCTRTLLIQSRCRRGCGSGQVARKRSLTEHRCPLPYPKMPASARRNGSRNGSTSAHQLNRESTCFASRATSARVHLLSVVSEGKSAIGAKILQDFRAVSVSNHAHHIFAHLLRRRGIRPKHLHDP